MFHENCIKSSLSLPFNISSPQEFQSFFGIVFTIETQSIYDLFSKSNCLLFSKPPNTSWSSAYYCIIKQSLKQRNVPEKKLDMKPVQENRVQLDEQKRTVHQQNIQTKFVLLDRHQTLICGQLPIAWQVSDPTLPSCHCTLPLLQQFLEIKIPETLTDNLA